MKGIVMHCRRLEYTDKRRSTWPKGIYTTSFEGGFFKASVVVLTCIEKGDTKEYIESAVQRVIELNKTFYKRKQIVIAPFVHLSNNIEHAKKAIPLLEYFQKRLQGEGFEVGTVSFGTDKDFLVDIFGHRAAVSYFEFPFDGKPNVSE